MSRPVRVTRHSGASGAWEIATRPPHPSLREHVWNLTGYTEAGAPIRRHELPFGGVVLVINLGPAIEIGYAGEPAAPPEPFGSFLAGVFDAPALTGHPGAQEGVQAYLSPLGAHAFLRVPMHELANRTVPLEAALGREARELEERIAGAPGWAVRLALLEDFLLARLAAAPPSLPDLVRAWRRLRGSDGRIGVDALAAELGCSRRHLAGRFHEGVGLPPKVVARILRFRAVLDELPNDGRVDWCRMAAERGYADQSHLIRDFRAFARTTPGEYLRSRASGLTAAEL